MSDLEYSRQQQKSNRRIRLLHSFCKCVYLLWLIKENFCSGYIVHKRPALSHTCIYFFNLHFVVYLVYMLAKITISKPSSTANNHCQSVSVTLSLALLEAADDFGMPWIVIINKCIWYLETPTGMSNTIQLWYEHQFTHKF